MNILLNQRKPSNAYMPHYTRTSLVLTTTCCFLDTKVIIGSSTGLWSIELVGLYCIANWITVQQFSVTKMNFKMSSAEWLSCDVGLDVLNTKTTWPNKITDRSVSSQPCLKIYQSSLNDQLLQHFITIFKDFLSACRKGYSCQSLLVKVIDDWKKVSWKEPHRRGFIYGSVQSIRQPAALSTDFEIKCLWLVYFCM